MQENYIIKNDSIPSEVEVYAPKKTGIYKFQFSYSKDLLLKSNFIPVWTNFDIDIVMLLIKEASMTLIEHSWDVNKVRYKFLFDSMNEHFKKFAILDLYENDYKKQNFLSKLLARFFHSEVKVGIWELNSSFANYFTEGDGVHRGSFWYLYCLKNSMSANEFIPLLHEFCYKYRKLLDQGVYDPTSLRCDDIVTHPDVESFIFKDFSSARLNISTSKESMAKNITEIAMQNSVIVKNKVGDISLTSCDHLSERIGMRINRDR